MTSKLLSAAQKEEHEFHVGSNADPTNFLESIVARDETVVLYDDPVSKKNGEEKKPQNRQIR